MQFTKPYKEAIARGDITTSFRAWKKPMAKVGGEYNIPPYGAIRVTAVATTTIAASSPASVRAAGFATRAALASFLDVAADVPLYRVTFRYLGDDPVKVPTRSPLAGEDLGKLLDRLRKLDWAAAALALIRDHPRTRAGDLAPRCGQPLPDFKKNVRRLKALGLTLSHDVGYELSERGRQALAQLERSP